MLDERGLFDGNRFLKSDYRCKYSERNLIKLKRCDTEFRDRKADDFSAVLSSCRFCQIQYEDLVIFRIRLNPKWWLVLLFFCRPDNWPFVSRFNVKVLCNFAVTIEEKRAN